MNHNISVILSVGLLILGLSACSTTHPPLKSPAGSRVAVNQTLPSELTEASSL